MGSKQSPSTRKDNLEKISFLEKFKKSLPLESSLRQHGDSICMNTPSARKQLKWIGAWQKSDLELNFCRQCRKNSHKTHPREVETENCIRKGWFDKESKTSQSVMFYWPWNKLSVASNALDRYSAVISTVLWLLFTTHWKLKFTEVEICAAASTRFLVMPTFNEILVWLVKKCRRIAIPVNDIISRGIAGGWRGRSRYAATLIKENLR